MTAALKGNREAAAAGGGLVAWAARSGLPESRGPGRGGLRFVFYGRVSTEDWQDPVTSRARQREQAGALVRGHGVVVAEFFDAGQSRTVAWGFGPEAAALVAELADPDRGWDAIVAGEYERAFYGSQYAAMAPLFEHYGVQFWMPEAGGLVDSASEHDEQAMTVLGLSSKREITRTSIRVCTAMAAQTRQSRYLGGRHWLAEHHRARRPGSVVGQPHKPAHRGQTLASGAKTATVPVPALLVSGFKVILRCRTVNIDVWILVEMAAKRDYGHRA